MLRELHRGGRFSEVKRAASPVTRETMEASGRQSRSVLGGPITDVFIGQLRGCVYTRGGMTSEVAHSGVPSRQDESENSAPRGCGVPVRGGVPRL